MLEWVVVWYYAGGALADLVEIAAETNKWDLNWEAEM